MIFDIITSGISIIIGAILMRFVDHIFNNCTIQEVFWSKDTFITIVGITIVYGAIRILLFVL